MAIIEHQTSSPVPLKFSKAHTRIGRVPMKLTPPILTTILISHMRELMAKIMVLESGVNTETRLSHLAPEPHPSPHHYAGSLSQQSGWSCPGHQHLATSSYGTGQKREHTPTHTILQNQAPTGCVTMDRPLVSISLTCHTRVLWG